MEAPRWRLTEPHYLNVAELPDGTRVEWEHKETARESGRTIRKLHPIPMLLDPKDAADFNHPGEIIVTCEVEGARINPRDYLFVGKPTPGMEPLNDAAEALSALERPRWEHPIDTLPVNGGMSSAEQAFMAKMMEAFARAAPPPTDSAMVPRAEFDELKAKLEALLAAQTPTPTVARRA